MSPLRFVIALHNHQPVGNFDNVFREAFEKCYDPFLKFLEEHPAFRIVLHYSGCLLDWLEAREKQFLRRLERLARKRQIELLSGGYYEPILPLIPERDAINQIRFMNGYIQRHFGQKPKGFWLTERVWEQKIPRLSAQAGLQYTSVDDTHFALAGLSESEIKDLFVTEEEGAKLYVFPIPKFLRYSIPFREPHETLQFLKGRFEGGSQSVTYADDGEKFGLWPGTHQWVYRDGWLERFAKALEENRSWLTLNTFREVWEESEDQPARKIYLPTASYEEMTEWSLSREKGTVFQRLKRDLETSGTWERVRPFFQGGIFKNFLFKYSEADWMRSKMMWVSRRVDGCGHLEKKREAERELWQGQCNCPYWHGVFGGLYLHHLRRSTYEHLIRSESLCDSSSAGPRLVKEDLNQDGASEIVLESPPFSFYFQPHRGGSLAELDFKPEAMNVLDVMTRRRETYHHDLVKDDGASPEARGKSIHDLPKTVSKEVLDRMAFDRWNRFSLLDHFLLPDTTLENFWKGRFHALVPDPTQVDFREGWKRQKTKGTLTLSGRAILEEERPIKIEKSVHVHFGEGKFQIEAKIINESAKRLECLWGEEWNLNFFDREKNQSEIKQVEIQDGWSALHLEITADKPFEYWQFPIETAAQTEADFRLIHQGISVFPHWRLELAPRESFETVLTFSFSSRR